MKIKIEISDKCFPDWFLSGVRLEWYISAGLINE